MTPRQKVRRGTAPAPLPAMISGVHIKNYGSGNVTSSGLGNVGNSTISNVGNDNYHQYRPKPSSRRTKMGEIVLFELEQEVGGINWNMQKEVKFCG